MRNNFEFLERFIVPSFVLSIERVTKFGIPRQVMEHFESNSAKYIDHESYKPGNFSAFFLVCHQNGDRTYIAEQTKKYDNTSDTTESLAYLYTMRGLTYVGHAEVRKDISAVEPIFLGRPFIGFIRTNDQLLREGHGTRMLGLMAAYAKARYGESLISGELVSETLRPLLEKLVREGSAKQETIHSNGHEYKVFATP